MTTIPAQSPAVTPQIREQLHEGTLDRLYVPRSPSSLLLKERDGEWFQMGKKLSAVLLIGFSLQLLLVIAATVGLTFWTRHWWPIPIGVVVAVIYLFAIIFTPRRVRSQAYQLREDDFVYRSGIFAQSLVTIPYGRLQLVNIENGPLMRKFGLASCELVTAASTANISLPGIPAPAADVLRDLLISVAETRRSGV